MTPLPETIAYLALGSNLGDRSAAIRSAIAALRRTPGVQVSCQSTVIETPPQGQPGQGPYLNAAVQVQTYLSPLALLASCLGVERAHGRNRNEQQRWGPRLLDIDVLLYGDQVINEVGPPRLVVPHPHLSERLFVLEPLAEIVPHVVHPTTGLTVQSLLDRLRGSLRTEYQRPSACSSE